MSESENPANQGLWLNLRKAAFHLQRMFFNSWIDAMVISEDEYLPRQIDDPVCYILENATDLEFILLEKICTKLNLPKPIYPNFDLSDLPPSYVTLDFHSRGRTDTAQQNKDVAKLLELQRAVERGEVRDVVLVPIVICWSRLPYKARSLLRQFFLSNWSLDKKFGRLLAALLSKNHTTLQYSKPLSMRSIIDEKRSSDKVTRKIHRLLRVHFRQQRQLIQGPDVSHRRTLIKQLVQGPSVRNLIDKYAIEQNKSPEKVEREVVAMAYEIAADMSFFSLRFIDSVLGWVWNKIYRGIKVHGIERIKEAAQDHEIVYLPCHRSYIDFLLLSYLLYYNGISLPHIAAGINLNILVVGRLLRKCGAFFMRRTFSNALYAAVFQEYFHLMLARGHSIEFFLEGGRTRTGLLLKPKRGMLGMLCKSQASRNRLPIAIAPVYFGYEKVMEDAVYMRELGGEIKKQEGLLELIRSFKHLRGSYGETHVNFGPLIFLDRHNPTSMTSQKVQELAEKIMVEINCSATILPINLIACCLFARQKNDFNEQNLKHQLSWMLYLLKRIPLSDHMVIAVQNEDEILQKSFESGLLKKNNQPGRAGELIVDAKISRLLTWYRNNIIHALLLPAVIGTLWQRMPAANQQEVTAFIIKLYPYIRQAYYLPWAESELPEVVRKCHAGLEETGFLSTEEEGLLVCNPKRHPDYIRLLSFIAAGALNKFSIIVQVLRQSIDRSRNIDLPGLTSQSLHLAESLSSVGDVHVDFVDRESIRDFIKQLIQCNELTLDEEGYVHRGTAAATIIAGLDWLIDTDPVNQAKIV